MQELEARRYRITGVLGKGGFGKVYRATMEGAGGFHKNVAIKLLRDADVPELTLQRFRDEARILGLIRDRAIVNVDPPTRLAGRWAVVMEYVDGTSLQRLLKLGPVPAAVTAEILQEIARVLDKVYRSPGPSGEPLRLLHRDIKPANIQITPDGEVKILDFGIAKADFSSREAHTQAYVGGTKGFIAPERLQGRDGPEGDIFSLGVTAHLMILGERPSRRQMMGLEDPDTSEYEQDTQEMIALCNRMRSVDPDNRPAAREVEETCAAIRRRSDGISLRRWAEENVERANALSRDDEMVGSVLSETLAAQLPSEDRLQGGHHFVLSEGEGRSDQGPSRLAYGMLGAIGLLAVVGLAIGAGSFVLGGGVLILGLGEDQEEALAPATPGQARPGRPERPKPTPSPTPTTAPAPVAPQPEERPAPAPAPATPTPTPTPQPAPAPDPTPAPTPAPAPATPTPTPQPTPHPAPEPEVAAATITITFASVPLGADVEVDGKVIGRTPVMGVQLTEGSHTVKMISDSETVVKTIVVGRRNPSRYVWKGGDAWEAHY
ncbi:MAG: serine/threonine protein kinase [Alphaproteobacteria bacterium]|nr:serine/threonine protein kinase [Alphaproteobacteria bacterium]MCB9695525.1 serine/threonine protein kinase [Alphaproteobacteria bacterium]